jgi:hypothetical protein
MSRKTEQEFMEEGFSGEELAALNGTGDDGGSTTVEVPVGAGTTETVTGDLATDALVVTEPAKVEPEPKMVDVRALHEARAEIRKRDEALAKASADQARLDERIKLINEAMAAQNKPPAPAIPTEEDDPFGYTMHELKATKAELQAMREERAQEAKQAAEARQHQAVIDRADMALAQAREKHADMDDAFQFATKAVQNEIARRLQQAGVHGDQFVQQANQMYQATLATYARDCPADPDEAAEHSRRHARYWGWTGAQQAQAAQQAQIAQPVAQQPVAVQPTIQQRAEQQDRHMSLSGIQGGAAPAKLDAKSLGAMSDAQYNALLASVQGRKQIEEIMGAV